MAIILGRLVTLYLKNGRTLQSEPHKPKGDPDDPLSDGEIREKFHRFSDPVLGADRARRIDAAIETIDAPRAALEWLDDLIYKPWRAESEVMSPTHSD